MSESGVDLKAALGTYAPIVATAFQGVQVINSHIQEAILDGDYDYAAALVETLETNVKHFRVVWDI